MNTVVPLTVVAPLTRLEENIKNPGKISEIEVSFTLLKQKVNERTKSRSKDRKDPKGSLSDLPRQKLREIFSQYGSGLLGDPQKVRALLMDYCGSGNESCVRDINVLMTALEQGVPQELSSLGITNSSDLFRQVSLKKILTDTGMDESVAAWVIEAWANALVR
jgi:hypothetical protein